MNWERLDVQAGFRKGKEAEIKLPTSVGSQKKTKEFQKNIYFSFTDYAKSCGCADYNNLWKIFKEMKYQTTLSVSWESYLQVKKQQLELHMQQKTGSKLRKEYNKVVCCHLAYLTSMQSTSFEMLAWMKHKLESRLPEEISTTSDIQMIPP